VRERVAEVPQELGLVVFDHDEVMAAVLDHLRAEVTLAEHRIAGNDPAFEHHPLEQSQRRLVLVGLGADLGLPQRQAAPLSHHREQVDGPLVAAHAAPDGLAVQGKCFEIGVGGSRW
jgi:hypothetical protein